VGSAPHWIAYTHGGPPRQIETIDKLADQGAFAIYIQGGTVDCCFNYNFVGGLMMDGNDRFDDAVPWLEHIRERGCVPGLGSHWSDIIRCAEERGYGAESHTTTLNNLAVYCDYYPAVRTINTVQKPFVVIKTLGGGAKIAPSEGLTCAYTAIKKTDAAAIGLENEESAEYDANLAREIMGWLEGKAM
jgi:hypothetical protein